MKIFHLVQDQGDQVIGLFQPFKGQPHKIVKHTQTIRQLLPTNCLSMFDHIVWLTLKGLTIKLIPSH